MSAAVALDVGPVGFVAAHRRAQPGRAAAMVGVGVAQYDARDRAERRGGRRDRRAHLLRAGVEHGHAVRSLEQVGVDEARGRAARDPPHAVCDPLRVRGDPAAQAGARVHEAVHPLLGRRSGRREQADLAREVRIVDEGVEGHELAVARGDEGDALDVDPRARGLDAVPGLAAERAAGAPAHGGLLAVHVEIRDLEVEVGEGRERLAEFAAIALGHRQLAIADEPADATRGPVLDHPLHVAGRDGPEVAANDGLGLGFDVGGLGGGFGHGPRCEHYLPRPWPRPPAGASWGAATGSCRASGACACPCPGPACPTATPGRWPPATAWCWWTRGCTSRARSRTWSVRSTRSTCAWTTCGSSSARTRTPTTTARRRRSSSGRAASCGCTPTIST